MVHWTKKMFTMLSLTWRNIVMINKSKIFKFFGLSGFYGFFGLFGFLGFLGYSVFMVFWVIRFLWFFGLFRRNQEMHELLVRAFLDLGEFFCFSEFFVVRDELLDVCHQNIPHILIASPNSFLGATAIVPNMFVFVALKESEFVVVHRAVVRPPFAWYVQCMPPHGNRAFDAFKFDTTTRVVCVGSQALLVKRLEFVA